MNDINELKAERNLYKGKYLAFLKLIIRARNKLVQVTDHIEDEGDRCYFGSSNHADDLKELYHEMMSWIWDAEDETNRMKSDPYADIRKQRARAKAAEAERDALRDRVAESQWQPIETAPRDGTPVDLWGFVGSHTSRAADAQWGDVIDYTGTIRKGWCHGEPSGFEPTHWMRVTGPALSHGDQP